MSNPDLKALHFNGASLPRLDVQQAWWGMTGIGQDGREWSLEEKFERIAEAGFTGIFGRLPAPEQAALWRRKLDEYGFSLGVGCFPASPGELAASLRAAADAGAQYVNCQVMDNWVIGEQAIGLLEGLLEAAAAQPLPVYIETHRGRITQDLHRTVDYVRALPRLRLTIDLSHYVVAGEMTDGFNKAEPYFEELLQRTGSIHARVSNGEQVQVDIGPNAEHPMAGHFQRAWARGMRHWLGQAASGDALPVVPELGPPGYAIAADGYAGGKREISDRWSQSLLLKDMLEAAWRQALEAR